MAHPHHHAVSSSRKWGGTPDDYIEVHNFFDQTKALMADFRHRALLHSSFGIFLVEQVFGATIELSTCMRCGKTRAEHGYEPDMSAEICAFKPKLIPVRWIGEQHVQEDLGFIPSANQWLERIQGEPWMNKSRRLSKELDSQAAEKGVTA